MAYKKVIFLGNGFDKACNLKTGYEDFVRDEVFNELIKNENSLAKHIKDKYDQALWVDIENELGLYSKKLTSNPDYSTKSNEVDSKLKKEFDDLKLALQIFLRKSTSSGHSNTLLEKHISDKGWYAFGEEAENTCTISFNYTHTTKFNSIGDYAKYDHIKYIHGSLNLNGNDITCVIGVDESCEIHKNHMFLYKSFSDNISIHGIMSIINNAEEYIFFGVSLGETDQVYFKSLFQNSANKKYTIYNFGEVEKNRLKGRIDDLSGSLFNFREKNNTIEWIDSKQFQNDKKP